MFQGRRNPLQDGRGNGRVLDEGNPRQAFFSLDGTHGVGTSRDAASLVVHVSVSSLPYEHEMKWNLKKNY